MGELGELGELGEGEKGRLSPLRFFWKNIPKIMGQNPKHFWTKFRKLFGQKARDFCSKNVLSYSVYDGTVVNGITEELFWTKIPRHFCQKTRGNFQEKGGENLNKKWGKTLADWEFPQSALGRFDELEMDFFPEFQEFEDLMS